MLLAKQFKNLIHHSMLNNFWFATSKFATYREVPIEKHHYETNFMRSSGPGGQSVNTTNSKAQIRIKLKEVQVIDEFIMNNLKTKYKNYISKDNEFVLRSQIHKSQAANLDQCIVKAKKLIYECSLVPEQRRFDIPAESDENKEKRLQSKKKKSEVKSRRQNNKFDFY